LISRTQTCPNTAGKRNEFNDTKEQKLVDMGMAGSSRSYCLGSSHLAPKSLRESSTPPSRPSSQPSSSSSTSATTFTTTTTYSFSSFSIPTLIIATVSPSSSTTQLSIECFLVLLDKLCNFLRESESELLKLVGLDAVENDNSACLIERGSQLFIPDHLGHNGCDRSQGKRKYPG
jgi:hypothetical protein